MYMPPYWLSRVRFPANMCVFCTFRALSGVELRSLFYRLFTTSPHRPCRVSLSSCFFFRLFLSNLTRRNRFHFQRLFSLLFQLLTFDKGGVSGHADHAAVHGGVLHFHRNATQTPGRSATGVDVFELTTTGMFRKYSGLLDLPLSWVSSRPFPPGLWFVSLSMRRAWRAMSAHRSQFVWYRRLFVVFSRYAYINTFRRVPAV